MTKEAFFAAEAALEAGATTVVNSCGHQRQPQQRLQHRAPRAPRQLPPRLIVAEGARNDG